MIPLIIGGVTLAVVSYAVKEICEEEGCPWDTKASTPETDNTETVEISKKSKEFHKFKKSIYKSSMQEY